MTTSGLEQGFRAGLLDRRRRLAGAISQVGGREDLVRLLREVDAALERADSPASGLCEMCGEPVEDEVLDAHPGTTYCLCDLSPTQIDALQHDLRRAWRLQAALLPPQDVSAAGWTVHHRYLPAGPLSGDYCDVQVPDAAEGPAYFFVGDVSGKGVAASLLMAHLNALLRSRIGAGSALPELVSDLNVQLNRTVSATHFATLVAARAGADGTVEICNAGHCPPLVVRPTGVERLDAAAFPLGITGESEYQVQRTRLSPGDSLVMYSDGLTDAMNASRAHYGLEALQRSLLAHRSRSSAHLAQACLDDLAGFAAGAPAFDDVTLMIARRNGAS